MERVAEHPKPSDETFVGMTVKGAFYSEKADAGNAILEACKAMTNPEPIPSVNTVALRWSCTLKQENTKCGSRASLAIP
jgi:hypothetical protein